MKALLFFLPVLALARPPVEQVPGKDVPHVIAQWHRAMKLAPKPLRTDGAEPFADNQKGDVLLWETYMGQPINVGDLYIADYPTKGLTMQCREARAVTATTIMTLTGTTIPLASVKGIVRRIVRVVP